MQQEGRASSKELALGGEAIRPCFGRYRWGFDAVEVALGIFRDITCCLWSSRRLWLASGVFIPHPVRPGHCVFRRPDGASGHGIEGFCQGRSSNTAAVRRKKKSPAKRTSVSVNFLWPLCLRSDSQIVMAPLIPSQEELDRRRVGVESEMSGWRSRED